MTETPPEQQRPTPSGHRFAIALGTLVLCLLGFLALLLVDLDATRMAILSGFVGTAFGWAGASVNYYLGSSQGSDTKQADILSLIRSKVP